MKKQQSTSQDTSVSTQTDTGQSAAAAAGSSNQDLLDRLGIPSLDDLADAGTGWLDEGLDAMGASLLGLAEDNAGEDAAADVGASFPHLVAGGLLVKAHLDEQAREAEVQRLVADEGLTLKDARAWVEAFGEAAFGEDEVWRFLIGPLKKFRDRIDHFGKFIAAVDALSTPDAHTRPADSLREFATLYELVTAVVPSPPVFSEFLCVYGKVLKNAANVLDALAETLVDRDGSIDGILYPGAHSGSREMFTFLKDLRRGRATSLDDGITEWLLVHSPLLSKAAGEDLPARKRELLGVDFLARDEVDHTALLQWCYRHMRVIAEYVWGIQETAEYWGPREDPTRG